MHPSREREHPWHVRRIGHKQLHDYRNLADGIELARAWAGAQEGAFGTIDDPLAREPTLEDDTWPDDVLLRLSAATRALQLRAIAERLAQLEKLAELSFQAGAESASRRWTQSDPAEGSIAPADKRALLMALFHSPLGEGLGQHAFLVRRSLVTEVSVELLQCPHQWAKTAEPGASPEAPPEAVDALCQQRFHWLRGHFNFLNPAIVPVISRQPNQLCRISW